MKAVNVHDLHKGAPEQLTIGVVEQGIAAAYNPGVAGRHDEGYCPFLEGPNIPYGQCGDASFVWTTSANNTNI